MEQTEARPGIDLMCHKLDDLITSCNDGLKGLTPQPTKNITQEPSDTSYCSETSISCCSETGWASNDLSEQFKKEMTSLPWPLCYMDENSEPEPKTLDTADITGPCGETDCKIARDMRNYIEDLVEEDNEMVNLDDLIGPCGSTECNFVKQVKDFIFHRGVFACDAGSDHSKPCSCTEQMKQALIRKGSSDSPCIPACENLEKIFFGGGCCGHEADTTPHTHNNPEPIESTNVNKNVQNMYYFNVQLDDKSAVSTPKKSPSAASGSKKSSSKKSSESKFKYCSQACPKSDAEGKCSKSACDLSDAFEKQLKGTQSLKCIDSACPNKEANKQEPYTPSPADSDVEINLAELRNPCDVRSCKVAERILDFIAKGSAMKEKCTHHGGHDPCFCDCAICTAQK